MISNKRLSFKSRITSFFYDLSNFRIALLLQISFFSVAFLDRISAVLVALSMMWGVCLLCKRGFNKGIILNIKFVFLVFCFIFSNLFTVLLHFKNNLHINIVYITYWVICFFLFYGMSAYDDFQKIKKEIIIFFKCFILINFILLIISPFTLFLSTEFIQSSGYEIGVYREERFSGIFVNPNLLGFATVVSLIMNFSIFNKNCFSKWFSALNIIVSFVSIFLCDSNSSILFLIIYLVVLAFCRLFAVNRQLNFFEIIKSSIILMCVCVGLVVSSFAMRAQCQRIVNDVVHRTNDVLPNVDNEYSYSNVKQNLQEEELESQVLIGRHVGSKKYKDVSCGRLELIKQGVKIFLKHPLMGVSRGNLEYYGKIYLQNGLRFPDLHNGYLTVLVSSGVVGFLIFLIFGVCVSHWLFSYLFNSYCKSDDKIFNHILSAICGYCVYSLFEKTILTETTFMTLFFWVMLGYAMSYANTKKRLKSIKFK